MPASPPVVRDAIDEQYAGQIELCDREIARRRQLDSRFRAGRGLCLVAILAAGFFVWHGHGSWWLLAIPFLTLVVVAWFHERAEDELAVQLKRRQNAHRQRARRRRDWSEVPVPVAPESATTAPIARDLDLFGPRSVFHWLSSGHTAMGRAILADWLVHPAEPDVIARRQAIVQALAVESQWRESLQLQGSLLDESLSGPEKFIEWATGPEWFAARPLLRHGATLLSLATLGTLLALGLGGAQTPFVWALLAVEVTLAIGLSFVHLGAIHDIFDKVAGRSDEVSKYLAMLQVAERLPAGIVASADDSRDWRVVAREGIERLASLRRITSIAGWRRGGLTGILVLIAQWTLLWEFHLLRWLEAWQRHYGAESPAWFAAIGELEALASLAAARADEPEWTFAQVSPQATTIDAIGLAHPLLSGAKRVANDVSLGPAGSFLLVTGSNMSGKSTLLRAIGVNVVLAQAGGPVCAQRLTLPPLEIATSMRVSDSLADGVSFFFAELLRLKQVVDAARRDQPTSRKLLYLLDEILQGTNSRERQTAVACVIGHLLSQGAIGAVSTHDLELAQVESLRVACRPVHFRETLSYQGDRRTMTFDYRLRSGLAPTTNALILLDMVGLGETPPTA